MDLSVRHQRKKKLYFIEQNHIHFVCAHTEAVLLAVRIYIKYTIFSNETPEQISVRVYIVVGIIFFFFLFFTIFKLKFNN